MKQLDDTIALLSKSKDIRLKEQLEKELPQKRQLYLNDIQGKNRIHREESAGRVMAALIDKGQVEIHCKRTSSPLTKIVVQKAELGGFNSVSGGFFSPSGGRRYFTPSGQIFLYVQDWLIK